MSEVQSHSLSYVSSLLHASYSRSRRVAAMQATGSRCSTTCTVLQRVHGELQPVGHMLGSCMIPILHFSRVGKCVCYRSNLISG